MRVSLVKIKNILGIESLEFQPRGRGITVIRGANESGKTSVLSAIEALVGGGHDATLLRKGTEVGEVVLVLDNGTEIRKRITSEKSDLSVKDPELGPIGKAKGFVDGLISADSFNPIEFLQAPAKQRVDMLLRGLPLALDFEQLYAIMHEACEGKKSPPPKTARPLDAIDSCERILRDERTFANRFAADKRTVAQQLKQSLPPEVKSPVEHREHVKQLEAQHTEAQDALGSALTTAVETLRGSLDSTAKEVLAKLTEVDEVAKQSRDRIVAESEQELGAIASMIADLEKKSRARAEKRNEDLRALEAKRSEAALKLKEEHTAAEGRLMAEAHQLKEQIRSQQQTSIDAAAAKLAVARAELHDAERYGLTKEHVTKAEADAKRHEESAKLLSDGLARLQRLRESLLKDLPVEGLLIQDGELYLKGVAFDRLSEAQRVELAVTIAKANAGKLGLIVVDGLEKLDAHRFEAFRERVEKWELQLIATKVDEGALEVVQ
jgi:DNA repair exonuclease SbcCD ATPase subunit